MKTREPKLVRIAVTVQEREHLTLLRILARIHRKQGWHGACRAFEACMHVLGDKVKVVAQ